MRKTHLDLRCGRRITVAEARLLIGICERHATGPVADRVLAKLREAYAETVRPLTTRERELADHRAKLFRERIERIVRSDREHTASRRAGLRLTTEIDAPRRAGKETT